MNTTAVVFEDVNVVSVAAVEVPSLGAGEVLIETLASVISPGTELRCLRGQQPNALPWPVIPGYALTGRVVAGEGFPIGSRVFSRGTKRASLGLMWGGHIGMAIADAKNVVPVPDGLSDSDAALVRLGAIAARGVRLAAPQPGESVVVIGLGPIGMLSARQFHLAGANVLGLDLLESRVRIAQESGVAAEVLYGGAAEAARRRFPLGADIVVDATGNPDLFAAAVACARDRGWGEIPERGARLVVQGSYPTVFSVPYQATFEKELTLLFPRDSTPAESSDVMDLASREPRLMQGLISEVMHPAEAAAAYRLLQERRDLMTIAFQWP